MPGGAATTAGMALSGRMNVAKLSPRMLLPAAVHLDVDRVRRHALEDHAVATERRRVAGPVGRRVLAHAGDVLEHDPLLAVGDTDESEPHPADRARRQAGRTRSRRTRV